MRITFSRAGGFAGRVTRLQVDLEQLADDDRAELERLVADSGFFAMAESYHSARRDAFEYTIEIDDGSVRHQVVADDGAAPGALRPLIDALVSRARRAPR